MLDQENLNVLEKAKENLSEELDEARSLTFMNLSGDITITWSAKDDEKVKELIRKKISEGYSFFSMKKVVIDSVKIKRKVGPKGIDKLDNLVIDDEAFEKMVSGLHDRDLAEALKIGTANLAKRRGQTKKYDSVKRLASPDDVVRSRQALAVKPVVGG